jgi:hypothetical protein
LSKDLTRAAFAVQVKILNQAAMRIAIRNLATEISNGKQTIKLYHSVNPGLAQVSEGIDPASAAWTLRTLFF